MVSTRPRQQVLSPNRRRLMVHTRLRIAVRMRSAAPAADLGKHDVDVIARLEIKVSQRPERVAMCAIKEKSLVAHRGAE